MLATRLEEKTRLLAPHFKPAFLQRHHTLFQFHFDDGEPFHLEVTPSGFEFREGIAGDPTIRLYIDSHETCWRLIEGSEDGMEAFMDGRYRADGNIVLSQLLLYLFKPAEHPSIYEVQD